MPSFLSTHPSHKQRRENLREWLPMAKKRYIRNALPEDTLAQKWKASDFKSSGASSNTNQGNGNNNSNQGGQQKGNAGVGGPPK